MTTENRDHDSDETWNESDAFVGKLAEALRELQSRFDSFAADIQRCETEREASIATLSENVHTLTFEAPPRPDQRGSIPWTVEWWNGSCLECWNSRFDDTWAGEVSGASTVFGREIEPPFLVIAIVEPDGTYRRIFLHAVYFDGSYIVPVDSGFERAMVARLIKAGGAFLKPVHMADYQSLPPIFHVPAVTSKKWPYRPDFLVFLRTPRNINELCIVEVRGFKVGTHCNYDLEWAEKKVWYESLRQIGAVRFEARNGWELEPVDQRAVLDITEFPHRFGGYTQTFDVGVLDGR